MRHTSETKACKGSEAVTRGVRVRVRPFFVPEQSRAELAEYVFGYRIAISNESDATVRLVSRRWEIVDADGERRVVEGEGVVGQQPVIESGGVHEYSSFCALATAWGTMEGVYRMECDGDGGGEFEARVERFYFVAREGGE